MVQEEAMMPAKAPVDRECGGRCESTDCCDADGRLLVVFEVGAMVLVEVLCSELDVDEIDRACLRPGLQSHTVCITRASRKKSLSIQNSLWVSLMNSVRGMMLTVLL